MQINHKLTPQLLFLDKFINDSIVFDVNTYQGDEENENVQKYRKFIEANIGSTEKPVLCFLNIQSLNEIVHSKLKGEYRNNKFVMPYLKNDYLGTIDLLENILENQTTIEKENIICHVTGNNINEIYKMLKFYKFYNVSNIIFDYDILPFTSVNQDLRFFKKDELKKMDVNLFNSLIRERLINELKKENKLPSKIYLSEISSYNEIKNYIKENISIESIYSDKVVLCSLLGHKFDDYILGNINIILDKNKFDWIDSKVDTNTIALMMENIKNFRLNICMQPEKVIKSE